MNEYLKNNQLLHNLHGLNYVYAETLVEYLRTYWSKDVQAVEEAITDVLSDMLEAQSDGLSAKEYFGSDPQTAADAIIRQLPPASLRQWLLQFWPALNILGVSVIVLTLFLGPGPQSQGIVVSGLAAILIACFFHPLSQSLKFNHWQSKTKWQLVGIVLFLIVIWGLTFEIFKKDLVLPLSQKPLIGLAGIVLFLLGNLALCGHFQKMTLPWIVYWLIQIPLLGLSLVIVLNAWEGLAVSCLEYLWALLLVRKQKDRSYFLE